MKDHEGKMTPLELFTESVRDIRAFHCDWLAGRFRENGDEVDKGEASDDINLLERKIQICNTHFAHLFKLLQYAVGDSWAIDFLNFFYQKELGDLYLGARMRFPEHDTTYELNLSLRDGFVCNRVKKGGIYEHVKIA